MGRTSSLINWETINYGPPPITMRYANGTIDYFDGGTASCSIINESTRRVYIVIASASNFTFKSWSYWNDDNPVVNYREASSLAYTYNGKTVYYYGINVPYWGEINNSNGYSASTFSNGAGVAWTMIYGEEQQETTQHIPVLWQSGYRAEPYQTSFSITVKYYD